MNYNTPKFSLTYLNNGGVGTVLLATECNTYDICALKGTLSENNIVFAGAVTVFDGFLDDSFENPSLNLDSSNKIWVAAVENFGSTIADRYLVNAKRSINPVDIATWGSADKVGWLNATIKSVVLVPQTSEKMALLLNSANANIVSYQFDGSSWAANSTGDYTWFGFGGGINDTVTAIVIDSNGILYAGGFFTIAGQNRSIGVAKWDGFSWQGLKGGVNDYVLALAITPTNELYAGGYFDQACNDAMCTDTIAASHVAKWDGANWSALGSGVDDNVNTLYYQSNELYVGGRFSQAGGSSANMVAKWDGNAWSALGNGVTYGTEVYTLYGYNGHIFMGGDFRDVGGTRVNNIADWYNNSWTPVGYGLNSAVFSMTIYDGKLVAGGSFYQVCAATNCAANTVNAYSLAIWDWSSWSQIGIGLSDAALSLVSDGTNLLIGGTFTQAGDFVTPLNHLAKWDGSSLTSLENGNDGQVRALAGSANNLYIGTWRDYHSYAQGNSISLWNGTSFSSLSGGLYGNTTPQNFQVLETSGDNIYAAGTVSMAGNKKVNKIAKWNKTTGWDSLGSGLEGDRYSSISTLKAVGSDLYVGGEFSLAGGSFARNIAKWDGSAWTNIGYGVNGTVYAIEAVGSDIYIGGYFSQICGNEACNAGNVAVDNIAKISGGNIVSLGSGLTDGNPPVRAFATDGASLYVGGNFTAAGGVAAAKLAKWNGVTWSAIGDTNGYVSGLKWSHDNKLYIVGNFTTVGGVNASGIAVLNNSEWQGVGGGLVTGWQSAPQTITEFNGNIVVAGYSGLYPLVNPLGYTFGSIAMWDGSSWNNMEEGTDKSDFAYWGQGEIYSLTVFEDNLLAVGNFNTAGTTVSPLIARWAKAVAPGNEKNNLEFSATGDSSGNVHMLYKDNTGQLMYKKMASDGTWGTEVDLGSSSVKSPSISIDNVTGDLYALNIDSNTISFKKGVAPYGSSNWDENFTEIYAEGSNNYLVTDELSSGLKVTWTNGDSAPYSVMTTYLGQGGNLDIPPVITVPALGLVSADLITSSVATLHSSISSTGGENATERGFEYGLDQSSTAFVKETGSYGSGDFDLLVSSLAADTTYIFRSYAINSAGTGYSGWASFSTRSETSGVRRLPQTGGGTTSRGGGMTTTGGGDTTTTGGGTTPRQLGTIIRLPQLLLM